MNNLRINRYLRDTGLFSRRSADEAIDSGRVTINGNLAKLGDHISANDNVLVDGRLLNQAEKQYLAYYKPKGLVVSKRDELGRETIYSSGKIDKSLSYIGRLDKDSEGLIILTNDGDLIQQISHPSFKVEKTYILKVSGDKKDIISLKEKFESGLMVDQRLMRADSVRPIGDNSFETTLHQGYNRQLRKMAAELRLGVIGLKRISIGQINLNNLRPGDFRHIKKEAI